MDFHINTQNDVPLPEVIELPEPAYIDPKVRKRPLVFVHSFLEEDGLKGITNDIKDMLEEWFTLVTYNQLQKNASLLPQIEGATVYPSRYWQLASFIDQMTSLKVLATPSVGVDKIPLGDLKRRGVRVSNTPGSVQQDKTVADFVILHMLNISRDFVNVVNATKTKHTEEYSFNSLGHDLTHKTIGILGMGRIGTEVAKRARVFEMKILYHNRKYKEDEQNATYCRRLEDMLTLCDFLVITCPLNPSSRHMIGEKEINLMKHSAAIINVGRGEILETNALVNALKTGRIHAVALDVVDPEPLPEGHPLLSLTNVFITPHSACRTYEAKQEMWHMVVMNLKAALVDGHHMINEIDPDTYCSHDTAADQ